jgi:hypothetical protein
MAMAYRELLKLDRIVAAIFIVLAALSFLDLYILGAKVIPCLVKVAAAPDNPFFWIQSTCSLSPMMIDLVVRFTWSSYLVIVFYVLILPYLLACLISRLIWKRKSRLSRVLGFLRLK